MNSQFPVSINIDNFINFIFSLLIKMIIKLQANNVGETFIQNINGARTKTYGIGDGVICDKTVEIKTSHRHIQQIYMNDL
jgi:hypothetical protein